MPDSTPISVGVVYPEDPVGEVIGGIHSFVRGLIKFAPDDIRYTVFGATTSTRDRPVGQLTTCRLDGVEYDFFPLYKLEHGIKQSKLPTTVRYEAAALARMPSLSEIDVLESHRIEHLAFRGSGKPKNMFVHQNMEILRNPKSDIRWKYMPGIYFAAERRVFRQLGSVYCVREDAAIQYREKYPDIADRIHFLPTWMDPDVFFAPALPQRQACRSRLVSEFELDPNSPILLAVGRLDHQKAPEIMVEAIRHLQQGAVSVSLIWVGDGVLRDRVAALVEEWGLSERVRLAGMRAPAQVADYYRGADLFVMSSAYEGMPIAMLEALASGTPVVSTRVGETGRLVTPGVNGELCEAGGASGLADALNSALPSLENLRGEPCTTVAARYRPDKVLTPVYENYRRIVQA